MKNILDYDEYPEETVLLFSTSTCSKCPAVKNIAEELEDNFFDVEFIEVKYDYAELFFMEFDVMKAPTIIALKNGEEVKRLTGEVSKNEFVNLVNEL